MRGGDLVHLKIVSLWWEPRTLSVISSACKKCWSSFCFCWSLRWFWWSVADNITPHLNPLLKITWSFICRMSKDRFSSSEALWNSWSKALMLWVTVVFLMMMRRRLVSNLNAKNSMLTEARLWDWAFFLIVGPELKTLVHHQWWFIIIIVVPSGIGPMIITLCQKKRQDPISWASRRNEAPISSKASQTLSLESWLFLAYSVFSTSRTFPFPGCSWRCESLPAM